MPISTLINSARAIRQSHLPQAQKNPVKRIDSDVANNFNKLLDASKKKYPEHPFIGKMKPVTPTRTQLSGLLAKVDMLEVSLETEKERLLRSLAESG